MINYLLFKKTTLNIAFYHFSIILFSDFIPINILYTNGLHIILKHLGLNVSTY